MDVVSTCPLRVTSVVWQHEGGAAVRTVICKATYQLLPGTSELAPEQLSPFENDAHAYGDPARSLHAASDVVPFKARADVVLVGHAYAPLAAPVRSLVVRLAVGALDKTIEVWCDRLIGQDGRLREVARFRKAPLAWERAAGGLSTANPVGVRFDAAPDSYGYVYLPSLQPPGSRVARRGDTFAPIGFGPIAPTWSTRTEKLGDHAADFPHRAWSSRPLPAGLDPGYFNVAPLDQQLDALHPDEHIVLEHLNPTYPRLATSLCGVRPRAYVEREGRAREELPLVCDTLWIDTDRAVCALVWRGQIALAHVAEAGKVVVSMEDPRRVTSSGEGGEASPAATGDEAQDTIRAGERSGPVRRQSAAPPRASASAKEEPSAPAAAAEPAVRLHIVESAKPAAAPDPREAPAREIVELLWQSPGALSRVRKQAAWKDIAARVAPGAEDVDADDEAPAGHAPLPKGRREVLAVLTRGEAIGAGDVARALAAGVGEDGVFAPPLALIAGELELPFDEAEVLEATLAVASLLAWSDRQAKETLAGFRELCQTPWAQRVPSVLEGLVREVREVLGRVRVPAARQLDEHVQRALLARRSFQKRMISGRPRLRGLVSSPGTPAPVPVYLPEALANELPGFQKTKVRLLAEVRPQLDPLETHAVALRAVALARVVPAP